MKKEKEFKAKYYDKLKRYMCKVQVHGNRQSFYGDTEEEAIAKARIWYDEQIQKIEDNLVIEEVEESSSNNKDIIQQLDRIENYVQGNVTYNSDDVYITVEEASKYLRISTNQMYSIVHRPDFPRQKIGRKYRILVGDLKEYLKRHRFSQIKS